MSRNPPWSVDTKGFFAMHTDQRTYTLAGGHGREPALPGRSERRCVDHTVSVACIPELTVRDTHTDRRPALLSILRTLLVSYSTLTKSLLAPPPPTDVPPEWRQHVEWITVMAQNIMAAANDLRPVQARCNLELMMKRQLDLRREETRLLHEYGRCLAELTPRLTFCCPRKCDAMEAKLAALRQVTAAKVQSTQITSTRVVSPSPSPPLRLPFCKLSTERRQ